MTDTTSDEEFLLAVLNSTPVIGGMQTDEFADTAQARVWLASADGLGTEVELLHLREVRLLLQAVVVLAWHELARNNPGRLRPCANDECRLFLIDHSKANAARWCSMAVCGNRMKARRHYQRIRTS
jgi:predicted RNA-binding Zn ribbon-like protein